MQTFFSILILVSSLTLIMSVLLQEGNDEGLGALGGNSPDSQWGKNRGTSKEAMLQKLTIAAAAIFMISALVLAAK